MRTDITLMQDFGRFEFGEITLSKDEDLEIKFIHNLKNCDMFVLCQNNNNKYTIKAVDNFISIKNLEDGELKLSVILKKYEKEIKKYLIEPLIIRKSFKEYTIIPEFEDLKNKLKLETEKNQLKIEELSKEVELLHKLVYAYIKGE